MAEQKRTRVAVVVFADVDGDIHGGHHVVERLIREKLGAAGTEHTMPLGHDGGREITVRFAHAMDAGAALGNGYLWAAPTARPFRDAGLGDTID
jgi:hypothetical protein